MRQLVAVAAAMLVAGTGHATELAIVLQDESGLRQAPGDRARPHAFLWQGEIVEVRGEALDFLSVYDYRRERGGFVRASRLRRLALGPQAAPELLAVLRFLRDSQGSEALGLGFAAAYVEAAPPEALNGAAGAEALDALGTFASRLAGRASRGARGRAAQRALAAHLEVAARHGVRIDGRELGGRLSFCYDGAAYRRVLAMASSPEQRARAALALTRPECLGADLSPAGRLRADEWRADVLDRVDESRLVPLARNRVLVRRAAVWAGLAYHYARQGVDAGAAGRRALQALAGVRGAALAAEDHTAYAEAAVRVGASRWAIATAPPPAPPGELPRLVTRAQASGETCVLLVNGRRGPAQPLAKRCTYGLVWIASQSMNREATALALAVQQTEAWRELWVFRKARRGWTVRVLPPAAATPGVGYAEFAGWLPGGQRMLVARELARARTFELLQLDTLAPVARAGAPGDLPVFLRWQDPAWKAATVSLR